jgi:LysR family carnitine catabolism transcriptional activator
MDLRHLEYVVAIVDHGGVGRAATALHVAQPSVSASVRRLERELGVDLFDRIGRRLVLTDAGSTVVDHARQLLAGRERLEAALAEQRGLLAGTLRIVSLPTLATEPLTELVVRFAAAHPGVHVEIAEPVDADDLERRVSDGRSELGLTDLALTSRALRHVPLTAQPIVAVLPPGHGPPEPGSPCHGPRGDGPPGRRRPDEGPPGHGSPAHGPPGRTGTLTVAELADLPLVTTPPGTSTRTLLDQVLRRRHLTADIVVETAHREAIVPLVLAGVGATVLPAPLAADAAVRGAVLAELDPPVRRRVGLVHRPGPLSPAARAFRATAAGH